MNGRDLQALVAEFVGTFALVFAGAGAAALGLGGLVGVAFAHGLVVVGMVYAYGHLSGAHINPAVSIAVWAAGRMPPVRAVLYVLVQLLGGLAAGYALCYVLGGAETGLGVTVLASGLEAGGATIHVTPPAGVFVEAVLTFFLANAVLHCAVAGRAGELAGMGIGLTLVFCILVGGPLTGASLNPSRTLGPAAAAGNFTDFWVYLVGPVLGGVLAALLFRGVTERS